MDISELVPTIDPAAFGKFPADGLLEKPETVTDAQRMVFYIYYGVNKELGIEKIWSRLVRTMGLGVLKNIRKNREAEYIPQLANATSYFLGIANLAGFLAQDALWFKFPGCCSYCLKSEDCECMFGKASSKGKTPEGQDTLQKLRSERKDAPFTWREHQLSQKRIYSGRHEELQLINLAAHVNEEICEVGEEIEAGACGAESIKLEVADGISWLLATCNFLNRNREAHRQIWLGDLLWEHYPYVCKKCHRNVCCGECGRRVEVEEVIK